MSTKAQIQTSINTINTGGNNTAAEVRQVFNDELDNAYGNVVLETFNNITNVTPNTTPNGVNHHYSLVMVKQGREVTMSGNFTNKTGAIISNEAIFSIDAGQYYQDLNIIGFYGFLESNGTPIRCSMNGSSLMVVGALGNNITVRFNFKYFTQD